MKKYVVRLHDEERKQLTVLVNRGRVAAHKRRHAQILLKADIAEDAGPGWPDQRIADAFSVGIRTVERIRERLCKQGLDAALERAKGSGKRRKIDGAQEAHLVALVCGDAPEGRSRWTLRLLADRFVELGHIDSISYEAVRQLLKKTKSSPGKRRNGAYPQRPMLISCVPWRMCWMFISACIILNNQSYAWMSPANSTSKKCVHHCP